MDMYVRVTMDADGPVVVKAAAPAAEERLRLEIDRLRRAGHPGVVAMLPGATDERDDPAEPARLELRTRYAGEPVTAWAGTVASIAGLGAAVAATLADLHGVGVVHGRLDAGHVLVGDDGRPRLCGFSHPGGAEPSDDVAGLGGVLAALLDRAARPPGRRGWWRARRSRAGERALRQVVDRAVDPVPSRRPTALALADAILLAVPSAELPPRPERAPAADPDTLERIWGAADQGTEAERWTRALGDGPPDLPPGPPPASGPAPASLPLAEVRTPAWASTTGGTKLTPRSATEARRRLDAATNPMAPVPPATLRPRPAAGAHQHRRPAATPAQPATAQPTATPTGTPTAATPAATTPAATTPTATTPAATTPAATTPAATTPAAMPTRPATDLPTATPTGTPAAATPAGIRNRTGDRSAPVGPRRTADDGPVPDRGDRLSLPADRARPPAAPDARLDPAGHADPVPAPPKASSDPARRPGRPPATERTRPDDPGGRVRGDLPGSAAPGNRWPPSAGDSEPGSDRGEPGEEPGLTVERPHLTGRGGLGGRARPPGEPVPARARRRWPTAIAGAAAAAVILLAAAAVSLGARGPGSQATQPPGPARPTAGCPAAAPPSADVDSDGCPDTLAVDGATITAGSARWTLGEPGDIAVVGDWDCDGHAAAALLRPGTGDVFAFPAWAESGAPVSVQPIERVAGATGIRAAPAIGGCDDLVVDRASGTSRTVEVPS